MYNNDLSDKCKRKSKVWHWALLANTRTGRPITKISSMTNSTADWRSGVLMLSDYQRLRQWLQTFAWWIPARFLIDLLISVIKTNVFLQQGCRKKTTYLWAINGFQGDAGDEVSFILYLMPSFQMWKPFCFIRHRSTTHTTTARAESRRWPQWNFQKKVLLYYYFFKSKQEKGARSSRPYHLWSLVWQDSIFLWNFSQFCEILLKDFCSMENKQKNQQEIKLL